MSTTASPGTNKSNQSSTTRFASTSAAVSQISYDTIQPHGNHVDPVALIDARIKVNGNGVISYIPLSLS